MRHVVIAGLGLAALTGIAQAGSLRDNFNKRALELKTWSVGQIQPSQFGFEQPGRCGGAALRITMKPSDAGSGCEACQRAEVQLAQQHQPPYGEEVWYAFSFRTAGDVPRYDTGGTIITQFKAPGDTSPFLAQRLDNGVFQITVEDNGIRRLIAKSEGDPEMLNKAQGILSGYKRDDVRGHAIARNLQALHRFARTTPDIASMLFTGEAQSGLKVPAGKDFTPASGAKVSQAFGLEGEDAAFAMREMVPVTDIQRYVGNADIEVKPGPGATLPNPYEGWVDMLYRVKGGRSDSAAGPSGKGEIDIWANGKLVANVRGNFANKLAATPASSAMSFKFGIYRSSRSYEQQLFFDEFAQGASREDVALPCGR